MNKLALTSVLTCLVITPLYGQEIERTRVTTEQQQITLPSTMQQPPVRKDPIPRLPVIDRPDTHQRIDTRPRDEDRRAMPRPDIRRELPPPPPIRVPPRMMDPVYRGDISPWVRLQMEYSANRRQHPRKFIKDHWNELTPQQQKDIQKARKEYLDKIYRILQRGGL